MGTGLLGLSSSLAVESLLESERLNLVLVKLNAVIESNLHIMVNGIFEFIQIVLELMIQTLSVVGLDLHKHIEHLFFVNVEEVAIDVRLHG